MINKTTRFIILGMTIIIIFIMIYLVNSKSFTGITGAGDITLGKKKEYVVSNTPSEGKQRIKNIAKENMPDIGRKYLASQNNIKIAISLPSSKEKEVFGNSLKTAIYMAESEIPSKLRYNYEFIVKDSYDKKGKDITLENLKTFIEIDKVNAILSVGSKDISEISQLSEDKKIPHISCFLGGEILSSYNYTINNYPSSKNLATSFIDRLIKKNLRLVSIVGNQDPNILRIIDDVENLAVEKDIIIVSKNTIADTDDNYKKIVSDIKKANPEVVLLMLNPEKINSFATVLNKEKMNFQYASIDLFRNFHNRSLIEGGFFITSSEGNEIFKKRFRDKTVLPIHICAPNLYDSIKMLILSFENNKGEVIVSPAKVMNNLKRIEGFKSATGDYISYKNNFDTKPIIIEIVDGKTVYSR